MVIHISRCKTIFPNLQYGGGGGGINNSDCNNNIILFFTFFLREKRKMQGWGGDDVISNCFVNLTKVFWDIGGLNFFIKVYHIFLTNFA